MIQLFSVLEFSRDEVSDCPSVVRLFEQSIMKESYINLKAVTLPLLSEMLETLLKFMSDMHKMMQL